MACTRGCVGIGICSGNICCIQFQQDCGTDCDGINAGFSRLQINADGELEVCSNVGGVCSCEAAAGGDISVLVDNDDGTATHDDGLGDLTVLDICKMFEDGGCCLDPDICNSAECRDDGLYVPSTFVVSDFVESADFVMWHQNLGNIPAAPQTIADLLPYELIVNNPSTCCDMQLQVKWDSYMLFANGGLGSYGRVRVSANPHYTIGGADQVNTAFVNTGCDFDLEAPAVGHFGGDWATSPYSTVATLAAGGSLTVGATLDLVVDNMPPQTGLVDEVESLFVQLGGLSVFGVCTG